MFHEIVEAKLVAEQAAHDLTWFFGSSGFKNGLERNSVMPKEGRPEISAGS
jgi:hypothetical protein